MNSYSRSSVQDVHHCPWRSWAHTVLEQSKESAQKKHKQWFPIIKAAHVIKNMKLVNIFIQDKILLQSHMDIASILSTGGL